MRRGGRRRRWGKWIAVSGDSAVAGRVLTLVVRYARSVVQRSAPLVVERLGVAAHPKDVGEGLRVLSIAPRGADEDMCSTLPRRVAHVRVRARREEEAEVLVVEEEEPGEEQEEIREDAYCIPCSDV